MDSAVETFSHACKGNRCVSQGFGGFVRGAVRAGVGVGERGGGRPRGGGGVFIMRYIVLTA
jgi:hypothetical protein